MTTEHSLCECGHPKEAHRWRELDRKLPSGRYAIGLGCIATVTRRHEHGDDSWPCACKEFAEAKRA